MKITFFEVSIFFNIFLLAILSSIMQEHYLPNWLWLAPHAGESLLGTVAAFVIWRTIIKPLLRGNKKSLLKGSRIRWDYMGGKKS